MKHILQKLGPAVLALSIETELPLEDAVKLAVEPLVSQMNSIDHVTVVIESLCHPRVFEESVHAFLVLCQHAKRPRVQVFRVYHVQQLGNVRHAVLDLFEASFLRDKDL